MYLTGSSGPAVRRVARRRGIGLIVQPGTGIAQIEHYPYWAADNGCFNPDTYIGDDRWLEWVDRLPRAGCLFVVIPDVARRPDGSLGGDPVATWHRFQQLAPKVKALGFPVALAAQDGIEDMANLDDQLAATDCLFIGGSTPWKVNTGIAVAAMARAAGCWTHMGRVNTAERYRLACANLIDSADGTFLGFGPDANLPRLTRWLDAGAQLPL
jgi:hypothetical protein